MLLKTTLTGWFNYDETIFNDMVLPDGIDKNKAIASILVRAGEFNIIYSNLEFLKFAIKNWSERHLTQFAKMLVALDAEYNPIYNYDRYEEYSDQRKSSTDTNENSNSKYTGNEKMTDTIENTVSADNSSSYQPDNKSTENRNTDSTNTVDGTTKGNSSFDETLDHNAHLYGNIGVTTSMAMVKEEIELRQTFGIYDIIAASFVEEFCIAVY